MQRKHIACLVAYGPEVRAFIHSGFVERLAEHFEVSIIARVTETGVFGQLNGAKTLKMPMAGEPRTCALLRSWGRRAKLAWLEKQGKARWRHYLPGAPAEQSSRSRFSRAVLGTSCGSRSLAVLERLAGQHWGSSSPWRALLTHSRVDCVIASSFASPKTIPALQTANNLGVKTIVITNSWKDVYVCPHVHVPPTRLVVWNERAKEELANANPNLPPESLVVSPPLQLERFVNVGRIMERGEFCRASGLDPGHPFICYTAAAPSAVENEEQVVEGLARSITDGRLPRRTQILLRLNPMEEGSRFAALPAEYPCLVVQKPQWEWNPVSDWNCAMAKDSETWLATAFHASLNVSIPSTVTLEFAALQKPVVNVCFDLPQPLSPGRSCSRFWEAPFYSEARGCGLVAGAFSLDELITQVAKVLNGAQSKPKETNVNRGSPVASALKLVQETLTK